MLMYSLQEKTEEQLKHCEMLRGRDCSDNNHTAVSEHVGNTKAIIIGACGRMTKNKKQHFLSSN